VASPKDRKQPHYKERVKGGHIISYRLISPIIMYYIMTFMSFTTSLRIDYDYQIKLQEFTVNWK